MIKVYPSVLKGSIEAPASAEQALKLMFAASLPSTATVIHNVPDCGYIDSACDCLTALGCRITSVPYKKGRLSVTVEPFAKNIPLRELTFNFKDCAPAAYFVTAAAAAYAIKARCIADGNLPRRQSISFTGRLALRGMTFSSFSYPFTMSGKLQAGNFEFRGDEGAQYITPLMMILPLLNDDSFISVVKPYTERPAIDFTIDMLKSFGIRIEERENGFFIPGRQYYESPGELKVENDWALSALWTSAGASCAERGGRVEVTNLNPTSHQSYRSSNEVYPLIAQNFTDLNINAAEFPELSSYFAALAISKGATIRISGVPQLKDKETNRLRSVGICFEQYGVKFESDGDGFWVSGAAGGEYPENIKIDTMGDPWVFMSVVLASAAFKVPITIANEYEADKIYKDFLPDFKKLGGQYEII